MLIIDGHFDLQHCNFLHVSFATIGTSAAYTQDCMASYWRQLVTRNSSGQADPKGQVWAVPYRWGCTLVAYNSDNLCRYVIAHHDNLVCKSRSGAAYL